MWVQRGYEADGNAVTTRWKIIMELMERLPPWCGRSVEYTRGDKVKRLGLFDILGIDTQACRGIQFMHSRTYIHLTLRVYSAKCAYLPDWIADPAITCVYSCLNLFRSTDNQVVNAIHLLFCILWLLSDLCFSKCVYCVPFQVIFIFTYRSVFERVASENSFWISIL